MYVEKCRGLGCPHSKQTSSSLCNLNMIMTSQNNGGEYADKFTYTIGRILQHTIYIITKLEFESLLPK